MCGIFGVVGEISEEMADICVDSLAHRGPDGRGIWRRDGITLGHRRLAILDLSEKGRQPMSYADGRYLITYNGEIYNFIEIRAELQSRGHVFRSDSDTEVILAAFVEWGEECLQKFNGMWAFAIWDDREKALFLSRDRFGKKPLFYASVKGNFAFASEMKALFPIMPEVRPNLNLVKDHKMIFHYESTDECVVEGIKRFPAGSWGIYRRGRLTTTKWWNTLDHIPQAPCRYEDQAEQLRALFLDACRLRMRSDVPLGTALSGGLDSSATISAMAHLARHGRGPRMNEDWQHAFVACFPGTPLDESRYARMVTDHLGIEATFLEIDPLRVIDRLDEYLYLQEDLYVTSPIPFMMTYDAMRSHGVKVTIDGHGADELFGGYPFDYLYALRDTGLHLKAAREILSTYYGSAPEQSVQFRLPPMWGYWFKWHVIDIARRLLRRERQMPGEGHARFRSFDALNKVLYRSVHLNVLPTLLRNYDRYSMANGVEIRMPFMDHRIVCYAFSLPWTSKVRSGFSKCIVRDAISPYMPHEVTWRKGKIGFSSPVVDWMKGPLRRFFLDTISSVSFAQSALIDAAKAGAAVRRVIADPAATFRMGEQAWTEVMPYLWEQAVIVNRPRIREAA